MGHVAAEMPKFYSGFGFSLRGEKNRFVLPPSFRNTIFGASGTRTLCLVQNKDPRCLTGFGLDRTDDFEAQVEREEEAALRLGKEFDRDLREMQLWSFQEVPFDASGRFVLPEALCGLVGITDSIAFLGGARSFMLWAPEELYKLDPADVGQQQAMCRQQQAEALARAKRK